MIYYAIYVKGLHNSTGYIDVALESGRRVSVSLRPLPSSLHPNNRRSSSTNRPLLILVQNGALTFLLNTITGMKMVDWKQGQLIFTLPLWFQ